MKKLDKNTKILIVGLGLIGGSYAEGLTKAGYNVCAITRSQSSIDYALNKKIIQKGTTEVTEEFVKEFDLIILTLYPHVVIEWLKQYQSFIKDGAIITDVTGVKGAIVYEIQAFLRDDLEFIGAHPMAGKEVYGVVNSDAKIFEGANYIVTPTVDNTTEAIEICKEIGKILKFKHISCLSPVDHDEMVGFLSQLTHCLAVSLMTCKESHYLVDYTGDSFRDLTRIAKINEEMWPELFIANKTELLSQMDLFLGQFKKLRNALALEDVQTMKEMMIESTKRRSYFDKENK